MNYTISKAQIEQAISSARIGQQLNDDRNNELHYDEKAVLRNTIDMLQSLLQQGEVQPVAWLDVIDLKNICASYEPTVSAIKVSEYDVPLFTHPPAPNLQDALNVISLLAAEIREQAARIAELENDAARLDFVERNGLLSLDSGTKRVGGNGQLLVAATRDTIDFTIQGNSK